MPSVTISSSNYSGQTANIVLYGSNAVITSLGSQTLPYVYTNQYVYGTYRITFPDLTECEIIVPPLCDLLYIENYTPPPNGVRISYDSNNGGIFIYYDGNLENVNYGDSIYITPIENTGTLYYIPPINGQYDLTFTTNGTIYFDFYNTYSLNNIEIVNNQTLEYINTLYYFTNPFLTGITISNLPNFWSFGNSNSIYLNYFSYLEKIDFSFLPQINFLDLSSNVISDINITGTPITFLNISYNNLSVNSQNHILKSLFQNGNYYGYLDMSYQSNNLCPDLNDPEIYNYYTGLTIDYGWIINYGPVCNNLPTPTPTPTVTATPTSTPTPTPTLPPLSPNTFVSTWQTNSPNQTISLPLISSGIYNFNINWGDGSSIQTITAYTNNSHTYSSPGLYNVVISGTCNGWNFQFYGTPSFIRKIRQWANLKIDNNGGAFDNCTYLDLSNVSDVLDLSGITNLSYMFRNCTGNLENVKYWNVSGVTNMEHMFYNASSFNENIGNWDVSNVTNMSFMFYSGASFNNGGSPSISGWSLSNVTDISSMFAYCTNFNQPIGNWDVSNVTNMNYVFGNATSFNQNIGNWNVSKSNNLVGTFYNASSFNNGGSPSINNWIVSGVTAMNYAFTYASSFNQPIGNWDVSNVTNMGAMFQNASSFNQPIGNWNVGNVTNMNYMFSYMNFNQDIGNWNVSGVTTMQGMFQVNPYFNQPIGNWNVSNVTNMGGMFLQSYNFNRPLSGWNVSNVTNMGGMFLNAWDFNQYIGNWDVINVTNMASMFYGCNNFNQPLSGWNVDNVTNMTGMFGYATNFNQDLSMWCVTNIPTNPANFDLNTPYWVLPKPVWGTCPFGPTPTPTLTPTPTPTPTPTILPTSTPPATPINTGDILIEYLVVAGGGGAGEDNRTIGGSGAGGVLLGSIYLNTGSTYNITVGAGGAPLTYNGFAQQGNKGSNSSISGSTIFIESEGGGTTGTQGFPTTQTNGGSGAGASVYSTGILNPPGTGIVGQGYNGGNGCTVSVCGERYAGGGGGASQQGEDGNGTNGAGNGGNGIVWLDGISMFGGGGGGSTYSNDPTKIGLGGLGGGGNGVYGFSGLNTSGEINTGGGAGGGSSVGMTPYAGGGSGIVIIRYIGITPLMTGGTITYYGGYVEHRFTGTDTLLT